MSQYQYREQEKHLHVQASKHTYARAPKTPNPHQCTFCGAQIDDDDAFCSECGNPRAGIPCPQCGTRSFRSFCPHCNTPVNEMGREAVAAAQRDPHFQRAQQLAKEMEAIEWRIRAARQAEAETPVAPERQVDTASRISEADRSALNQYDELFAGIGNLRVPDTPVQQERPAQPLTSPRILSGDVLKQALREFEAKRKEMQAELDAMLPPAGSTPEEQRNFFCARLVKVTTLSDAKQFWVCNYCGCQHYAPSECVEPQLGGKWIVVPFYKTSTIEMYD